MKYIIGNKDMRAFHAPIGITGFSHLSNVKFNDQLLSFVDKTAFLPELLAIDEMVSVVTRPPLFMKTSTLSMMEKFLSIKDAEDNRDLFSGLSIYNESYSEFREQYQGTVPVVKISLGSLSRAGNWVSAIRIITNIIAQLYEDYSFILPSLTQRQQEKYNRIMNIKSNSGELEEALSDITKYLFKHYDRKVVVLVDDYDKPLYSAYRNTRKQELTRSDSYFQMVNVFFSDFYSLAFKDNSSVEKVFMTGTLCVKYSTDISPNSNFNFHSFFSRKFAQVFGISEREIDILLGQIPRVVNDNQEYDKTFPASGKANKFTCAKGAISYAYGGYVFGGHPSTMHSPYSVMKYLQHLSDGGSLSSYDYLSELPDIGNLFEHISPRYKYLSGELCQITLGQNINLEIKDTINFIELSDEDNYDNFWSMFLHNGCFKISQAQKIQSGRFSCVVERANNESQGVFSRLVQRCMREIMFAPKPVMPKVEHDSDELFAACSSFSFRPLSLKRWADDAGLDNSKDNTSSLQRSL